MLELKSKRKLFFQRNKIMIEDVQSPLCLKLLKISSPKNHFFIKPKKELELVREQSITCPERELWHYNRAHYRTSPSTAPTVPWPVLPAPSPWLTSFIFLQCFTLITTRDGHHYHGPHAPLPQLGLCPSSWQSDPKGTLQGPDQRQGNVSFFLWFDTPPCPFLSDINSLN